MQLEIYILDLIGVFAFSVYGSYFALKHNLDLFGIFISAFLTALGGGTLREIIVGNIPFYFFDNNYIFVVLFGVFFTIGIYNYFHKIKNFAILIDSVGLVTFAFIGALKASEINLGLFGILFFSTLTAVGGGILRDIILNKTPIIFKYDFYASIAILLGFVYWLFVDRMQEIFYVNILILIFLFLRFIVIYKKIHLWKPQKR